MQPFAPESHYETNIDSELIAEIFSIFDSLENFCKDEPQLLNILREISAGRQRVINMPFKAAAKTAELLNIDLGMLAQGILIYRDEMILPNSETLTSQQFDVIRRIPTLNGDQLQAVDNFIRTECPKIAAMSYHELHPERDWFDDEDDF